MIEKLKHPELRTPLKLKEEQLAGWPEGYELNALLYLWKVDTPVGVRWYIQRIDPRIKSRSTLVPVDADIAEAMLK